MPSPLSISADSAQDFSFTSFSTTVAPALPNAVAIAKPIPLAEPVTKAVRPFKPKVLAR